MIFTSFAFLFFFLPTVLLVHEFLRSSLQRIIFLIFISLVFYGLWQPYLIILLLGMGIFNLWAGQFLYKYKTKINLWLLIIANILPLAYFKYSGLIATSLHLPFENGFFGEALGSMLVLGLSFLVLQMIAYLVDIYSGRAKPHKKLHFIFFVTFFPKLPFGPIAHHQELIEQVVKPHPERSALFRQGLIYLAIGFAKVFILAKNLAYAVDPLYVEGAVTSLNDAVIATFGFAMQFYFEFSGYADMAMGIALLFGYKLPINFNSPYKAVSVTDFWRRWHMSLNQFFKNYLYIPLGGNKIHPLYTIRNILIVMAIAGLWYGASWIIVLWGLIFAIIMIVEKFSPIQLPHPMSRFLTFIIVSVLWVLFRAENINIARDIYQGFDYAPELEWNWGWVWLALSFFILTQQNSHQIVQKYQHYFALPNMRAIIVRFFLYALVAQGVLTVPAYYFYTYGIDRQLYKSDAMAHIQSGIGTEKGDYRSNIFIHDVWTKPELQKTVIIGPAFTKGLDLYQFDYQKKPMQTFTLGIEGDGFINSLRTAEVVFDIPNLKYLVIGISPISLGESFFDDPYPGECSGFLKNIFGNPIEKRYMAECIGQPLTPLDKAYLLLTVGVNQKHFFQFHNFIRTYLTHRDQHQLSVEEAIPVVNVNYSFVQKELFKLDAEMNRIRYNRSEVKDVVTGSNNMMNWSLRGIDKDFDEKSLTMQLLRNLRKSADLFGVKIVFYETPTPMTADAAHIYPNGFFEAYRHNLKQALASLSIPYLDYSQLLPWSSEYFNHYTDLTPLGKRVLSLKLLHDLRVLEVPVSVEIQNPQMIKPPPAAAPEPLKQKDTGLQDGLNFKINEAYE